MVFWFVDEKVYNRAVHVCGYMQPPEFDSQASPYSLIRRDLYLRVDQSDLENYGSLLYGLRAAMFKESSTTNSSNANVWVGLAGRARGTSI